MSMFHHFTPESRVGVSGDVDYNDTVENFVRDFNRTPPPLPEGITERVYEPGRRHALIRGSDVVDGGPMPWAEGDEIIAGVTDAVASKNAREQAAMAKLRSGAAT